MKNKKNITLILVLSFFLIKCSPLSNADRLANKNEQVILYPDSPFNVEKTKSQIAKGKSTIRGILYQKVNKMQLAGGKTFGKNIKVTLFPVNEYFMEWYNLREKKETKTTTVYMSNDAFSLRIEVTTDEYGRFTFSEMKPGKYFLQAFMKTTSNYKRDVEVGTNSYGTVFYQKQHQRVINNHRVEQFIDIEEDGKTVEINLK
ncbi:carboxypeptidase-like regulatory domain-containing protein [Flavobacterium sp.]|uniref:carboxypeptidase-like regulatory domain-containing protein n=1 Tax=Flavobacterium sp. TaxID=239 RepID=UPI00286AAE64|nr:carboxypeptidase-like regulatory domain-containing protein [Flavobacterium sp.]